MNKKHIGITLAALLLVGIFLYQWGKSRPTSELFSESLNTLAATMPYGIPPTDAQKEAMRKIDAKYGPRIMELRTLQNSLLSPKQIEAKNKALEAAQKAGKTGKTLTEAVNKAIALTAEQKKKAINSQKELVLLLNEMHNEINGLLSADQRRLLEQRMNP